jgi:hypothetical protein
VPQAGNKRGREERDRNVCFHCYQYFPNGFPGKSHLERCPVAMNKKANKARQQSRLAA